MSRHGKFLSSASLVVFAVSCTALASAASNSVSVPGVAAIAFACIRQNECRLIGWSDGAYAAAHVGPGIRFNAPPVDVERDWSALLQFWRTSLAALATEFRAGVADVRPRDANVCNECNLHALCRISEVRRVELH